MLSPQAGLTYLAVIMVAALLSTTLAAGGIVWHFAEQRAREDELLYVGRQFRMAIGRYYLNQPGPQKEYPKRLDDLLRDPRHPGTVRYLRKLYADPMTGSTDWGLLKTPDGSILGVYSKSERAPVKIGHFRPNDRHLARKSKYSEWKFVYLPGQLLGSPSGGHSEDFSSAGMVDIDRLLAQPASPGKFGDPLPSLEKEPLRP